MSITCVICGTENPVEGEFCEGCGTELSLSQAFSTDQPINDSTQPQVESPEPYTPTPTSPPPLEPQIDSFTTNTDSNEKDSPIPSESPDNLQKDDFAAQPLSTQSSAPYSARGLGNTPSQSDLVPPETNDPFPEFAKSSSQPTPQAESHFIESQPASYPTSASQSTPTGQIDTSSQPKQVAPESTNSAAQAYVSKAVSTSVKPAKLVITKFGSITEESIPLQATPLIVGKFDPATGPVDIDLTGIRGEEYISKQHAELYFDGRWKVRDIGSTNGIYIRPVGAKNYNPRLQVPTELSDSDEISFGNVRFVFRES